MTIQTLIKTATFTLISALALTGVAACDAQDDAEFYDADEAVAHRGWGQGSGGTRLNTDRPLASTIPAIDLTLTATSGPRLVSAKIFDPGGQPNHAPQLALDELEITSEGELTGTANGVTYAGHDFIGAELGLRTHPLLNGGGAGGPAQYYLKIEEYFPASRDNLEQGHFYEFSIKQAGNHPWGGFCKVDNPHALLLADTNIDLETLEVSDQPASMFIGCVAGAAGKLYQWGYGPADGVPRDEYQAGLHAVLADYCGDNNPQTDDGTEISVSWDFDLNNPLPGDAEARWGLDGALCVDDTRKAGANTTCDGAPLPSCAVSNHDPADELLATSFENSAAIAKN